MSEQPPRDEGHPDPDGPTEELRPAQEQPTEAMEPAAPPTQSYEVPPTPPDEPAAPPTERYEVPAAPPEEPAAPPTQRYEVPTPPPPEPAMPPPTQQYEVAASPDEQPPGPLPTQRMDPVQPPPAPPGRGPGGPSAPKGRGWLIATVAAVAVLLVLAGGLAATLLANRDDEPTSSAQEPAVATTAGPTTTAEATATTAPATTQAPAQGGGTVAVVRSGFSQLRPEPDGDVEATWAAIVRNQSSNQVALDVQVVIALRDSGGRLVATDDQTIDVLLPGQTGAAAETTEAARAAKLDIQVRVTTWAPTTVQGQFRTSNVRTSRVAGEVVTTATLQSGFTTVVDADAVAVYHDGSGRVVGGASDGIDGIPPGGTVALRIDSSSAPGSIARTEVHANLSGLPPG